MTTSNYLRQAIAITLLTGIIIPSLTLLDTSDAAVKRYRSKVKPTESTTSKIPTQYIAPTTTSTNTPSNWQAVPYNQMPGEPKNLLFILDDSKSMEEHLQGSGETKLAMAKRVIIDTLKTVPPNVKVGLRVYGHHYNQSVYGAFGLMSQQDDPNCKASELMVPLAMDNHQSIVNKLAPLEPTGNTPISYSVQQAAETDFFGATGKKIVVLVSDGRETCSKFDPCDVAVGLVRKGIDIKFNVIGFDLNDSVAEDQLRCLALTTKGKFISADNEDQLVKGMRASTEYANDVKARVVPTP